MQVKTWIYSLGKIVINNLNDWWPCFEDIGYLCIFKIFDECVDDFGPLAIWYSFDLLHGIEYEFKNVCMYIYDNEV